MKRIKLLLMVLLLIPINIFASGSVSVNTSNLYITTGSSKTFRISASNAAGRVDVSSSNSSVATVSTGSAFLDNDSTTITVYAKSAGSATITVYVTDMTTYDNESLTGRSYKVNVNVSNPVYYSSNNNFKSFGVEGYELVEVDGNNYTLTVNNDVTSINVYGDKEDSKASISGVGVRELSVGENIIEVIVTAENGSQNKKTIKVTRKDGYYLEDIDKVVTEENSSVIISKDTLISTDILTKIKESGKEVSLNYFNENKELVYSWVIDGSKLDNTDGFSTELNFETENKKEMSNLSNYATGMYLNFSHSGDLPKGTKVKVNVTNNFSDGDKVNLYYYNKESNKLELVSEGILVSDNLVEFDLSHCSDYFLTMATVSTSSGITNITSNNSLYMIISLVELLIIVGLVIIIFRNKKKGGIM